MTFYTKSFATAFIASLFPFAAAGQNNGATIQCGQIYKVVSGDTLGQISSRAYGTSRAYKTIFEANTATIGSNPNLILIGQQLQIPCPPGQEATTAAAAPAEEPAAVVVTVSQTEQEVDQASNADPLTLTFNKTSAPKFIMNSGIIDLYLAEITEVTEGRVQFIDPEVMNRNPRDQYDLVTSGQVDGTYIFNGDLSASHPLLQLPMLPLMGGSAEQTAVSMWRLHNTYLSQTDYFDDAHLLGFIAAPAAHIWRLSDEPVVLGDDIAAKNNYAVPYFEGLDTRGPAAVRDEVTMRLSAFNEESNGTLTFFMAHGAARAAGVWTDDRTVTEVSNGLYTPTFSVVLSNEAWAQISEQDRQAIWDISGERLASRSASWDAFDNGHRSHMLDTGLNAIKADDALLAELESYSAARLEGWKAVADAMGVPGTDAINTYRSDLSSLQDRLIFE
jgi:LysM repeat protein